MATDTNVKNLIINKLTKAQYDGIAEKDSTQLYVVTDETAGIEEVAHDDTLIGNGTVESPLSIPDNYVKKSGDTMTGILTHNLTLLNEYASSTKPAIAFEQNLEDGTHISTHYIYTERLGFRINAGSSTYGLSSLGFSSYNKSNLGSISHPWNITYTKYLSSNESYSTSNKIIVPDNKNGTLALIEDLADYAKKSDIASVYKPKGSVASYADLPTENNQVGDVYDTLDTGKNYVWLETGWDDLGGTVDLSNYYTKTEVDNSLSIKANNTDLQSLQTTVSTLETNVEENYLSLNGNIMNKDARLGFQGTNTNPSLQTVLWGANGQLNMSSAQSELPTFIFSPAGTYIAPHEYQLTASLGKEGNSWNKVYSRILNNGADINVPTEAGTLARIEDLEDYATNTEVAEKTSVMIIDWEE